MLGTRVFEVKYIYVHKSSLAVNTIAENIFPQVDEEGNRFAIFYGIVDHRVYGTDAMQRDAFIVSNNVG